MAERKFLDQNGLLYVWSKIKASLGTKVDKVEGKGLSTNDLTNELLEKLLNAGDSSFSGVYADLTNKPKINNVELKAENTLEELGIQAAGNYATTEALEGLTTQVTTLEGEVDALVTEVEKKANAEDVETALAEKANASEVAASLETKVDKVEGKGLSTNDYTTEEKEKLAGIAEGANVNIIEKITVNGTEVTPVEKTVEITTATKTSELTNDSDFRTGEQVNTAISEAIADKVDTATMNTAIATATEDMATETYVLEQVANINKKTVVTSLEEMTDTSTIYLMANIGEQDNIYDEYILVEGKPEKIGTTEVDLTNYMQFSDVAEITNEEIDEIFAS